MANVCTTTYRITGKPEAVKDLWEALQALNADKERVYFQDLAIYYTSKLLPFCESGHILMFNPRSVIEKGIKYSSENNMLEFEAFSLWSADNDLFYKISKVLNNGLSINFREIEPGEDIFFICDKDGYFPEECCVISSEKLFGNLYCEPFDTITKAIDYWCEKMGIERGKRDDKEMLNYIENYKYDNENIYYCIEIFDRDPEVEY